MDYIYTAVLEPQEAGSGYFARVPDLPGCISSGKTIDEASGNIVDAMSIWLVSKEDANEPIPKPSKPLCVPCRENDVCITIQCDTMKYRAEIEKE